jgi:UDP-glucose:(glucosyl)LPS alpha-1,3-glucosyltransferase
MPTSPANALNANAFHIAFCVDNHYFRAMGAMIASIIAHNPARQFVFHVFAFSVSEDNALRMKEIEKNPNIKVVPHVVDKSIFHEFSEMIASSYYSLSTFTRLIVPSALKDVTDKVLYLDADMLCLGSLDELVTMDLTGTIALVAEDVGWSTPTGWDGRYSVLGMKDKRYFNAGSLYINIPEWERNHVSQAAIKVLLSKREKLAFNDQDALNIVLDGRVRYISIRWNYIYSMIADLKRGKLSMDSVDDAAIVHFAGLIKPWNNWSDHEAREIYVRYHALSAWNDTPLDREPLNHKEMRICSRSLMKRGKIAQGIYWYLRFLQTALVRKLKR